MDIYYKMLSRPVFSVEDVNVHYGNIESARSAVKALTRKGLAVKIRNNMYTCISGETKSPVANRFQIASRISPTSCLSHHSAMEFYGITNQIFYDVYVSSRTSFNEFEFDGYTFICVKSKFDDGIDDPSYSGGIRVTDKERTVIECIKNMDRISGLEEVVDNISHMRGLSEEKLKNYLNLYDSKYLYQKTGYLLSILFSRKEISDEFLEFCKDNIGKSNRCIGGDAGKKKYVKEWRLSVPCDITEIKNGGISYADIR